MIPPDFVSALTLLFDLEFEDNSEARCFYIREPEPLRERRKQVTELGNQDVALVFQNLGSK